MVSGLISVIVPAYNVAPYIQDCINSIISQTYKKLEVIIVDDGSSDDTYSIIREMIQIDDRIRYIYQNNQGVSAARNRGIEESKGEFIAFVDADDWLTTFFFEEGIRLLRAHDLDCILGQTQFVHDSSLVSNKIISLYDSKVEIYEKEGLVLYEKKVLSNGIVGDDLLDETFTSGPVCKIIRYETLEKLRFNTNLIRGEDVVFNLELTRRCRRIGVSNETWYLYRQNDKSVTKQYNPKVLQSTIALIETLYRMYNDRCNMIPFLQVRVIKQIYGALLIGPCSSRSPLNRDQQIIEIKNLFLTDLMKKILSSSNNQFSFPGSIIDKFFFWLAKHHLYYCFYSMLCIYKKIKNK